MTDFDTSLITRARSEPAGKRLEPYLVRRPYYYVDPGAYTAAAWRQVIARAPIVKNCIATLILQLRAIPWELKADDDQKVEYYSSVLDHANGEDWPTFLGRLVRDTLEVPFGGALEVVRWREGRWQDNVYSLLHVDGGSLAPTYDAELPYVQINPLRSYDRVYFAPSELVRVPWMMHTDLPNYGWSFTPCMDCFPAIESLVRSDVFYNTLLSDTPPPGILDLLDMSRDEAEEWAESFRATFEGIDRFKIPILYDHKAKAEWISFQETGLHASLGELVKRYAEIVCSSFGMSIVDLGLYEYSQTKAGGVAQLDASKRQGLGGLMTQIATVLNGRVFPDDVEFVWKPLDTEDAVRKAAAQKTRVDTLAAAQAAGFIVKKEGRDMLAKEGIIVPDPDVDIEKAEAEAAARAERLAAAKAPQAGQTGQDVGPAVGDEEAGSQAGAPKPVGPEESRAAKRSLAGEVSLYSLVFDELYRVRYAWEDCERTVDWETLVARARSGEDPLPVARTDRAYRLLVDGLVSEFSRLAARLPRELVARAVERVWAHFEGPVTHAATAEAIYTTIRDILAGEPSLDLSDEALATVFQALSLAYEQGLLAAAEDVWAALASNGHVTGPLKLRFGLTNPDVLEALRTNVVQLGRDLDEGTRSLVARLIYSGVREGRAVYAGKDSITAEILKAFPLTIGRRRAQSIALFEVNKVESLAHLKQYRTFGLTRKGWNAVESLACELCRRNMARGFVPLEAKFENVFGPCDGPPGHPTVCHCALRFDRQELLERARSGQFTLFDGATEVELGPEVRNAT